MEETKFEGENAFEATAAGMSCGLAHACAVNESANVETMKKEIKREIDVNNVLLEPSFISPVLPPTTLKR